MQNEIKTIPFWKARGFIKDPSQFIDSHLDLGSFYHLNLFSNQIYVVTDPDILHHVLIKNEANYLKSKIYWGQLKAIIGNALGTLEGEDWLWMKRLQQPFFTHEKVKSYLPEVMRSNKYFFEEWSESYTKHQGEDLIKAFAKINLAAVLKVIFGIEKVDDYSEIASYIADGEASIAYRSKFPWRPYTAWFTGHNKRAANHLAFFDTFTKKNISKKQEEKKKAQDMLDELILHSQFNNGKLSLKDIRNELIVHLGASTETAAVAEGWTLHLLNQHPKYLSEIKIEIDTVTNGNDVDVADYPQLVKTKRSIQEAMRLFPPSHAIIRDAQAPDFIDNIKIAKGATMFVSAYGLHRNPNIWENPTQFIPERFADETKIPKYHYIPFGAGRHTCIGRYLGLPQIVLSIATFLQRFNYELETKGEVVPLSLSTLKPNQPLKFKLKTRIKRTVSYSN